MTKLVAIVGPTGTGKSGLALQLAQRLNGEIICADSRTVYRGMDVGTAKPSFIDRKLVRHHLLDIADPDEIVNVAQFQGLALAAITEVAGRGRLPLLVGGSGLYIDSILYDYSFPGDESFEARIKNRQSRLEDLIAKLQDLDPEFAKTVDLKNRRRVERALETIDLPRSKRDKIRPDTLVLGLVMDKKLIRQRIERRIEKMLDEGLIDEVSRLGNKFGWDAEAVRTPAYLSFRGVVEGKKTIEEASAENLRRDMLLVKKQLTWFKRNTQILWLDGNSDKLQAEAEVAVRQFTARFKDTTSADGDV